MRTSFESDYGQACPRSANSNMREWKLSEDTGGVGAKFSCGYVDQGKISEGRIDSGYSLCRVTGPSLLPGVNAVSIANLGG